MNEQNPQPSPAHITPEQEKQLAMLAHISVLLNLLTAFMGIAVPIILYLMYKDRSKFVAYHSLQAAIMQGIYSFGGLLVAVLIGGLSQVIPFAGLICLPVSCLFGLLPLAALIYGPYGGIQVNNGHDFKYWLIGDWVRSTLTG